jgi:hypothetical protein
MTKQEIKKELENSFASIQKWYASQEDKDFDKGPENK